MNQGACQVKTLTTQVWQPEFKSHNPHKCERRHLTPEFFSGFHNTHIMHSCTHTHTHTRVKITVKWKNRFPYLHSCIECSTYLHVFVIFFIPSHHFWYYTCKEGWVSNQILVQLVITYYHGEKTSLLMTGTRYALQISIWIAYHMFIRKAVIW